MVRRLAQLFLSVMLAWGPTASAEDTLIWLLRDLPPLTIFEGPSKGQGALDQLLPILIQRLPEYRHQVLHVNRARGMQMLREPTFTCDPSLLWTAERARYVVFSSQAFVVASNGVTVRRNQQEAMAPYITQGQFDLQTFLDAHKTDRKSVGEGKRTRHGSHGSRPNRRRNDEKRRRVVNN